MYREGLGLMCHPSSQATARQAGRPAYRAPTLGAAAASRPGAAPPASARSGPAAAEGTLDPKSYPYLIFDPDSDPNQDPERYPDSALDASPDHPHGSARPEQHTLTRLIG